MHGFIDYFILIPGLVSETRFQMVIDDIIKHNNLVDKDHYDEAYWHCNGEQITEGT